MYHVDKHGRTMTDCDTGRLTVTALDVRPRYRLVATHRPIRFYAKPECVSQYWNGLVFVRSLVTKLAPRISRKRFDLESPNFYVDIHTDIVYSQTEYGDVIIYFRLAANLKNV